MTISKNSIFMVIAVVFLLFGNPVAGGAGDGTRPIASTTSPQAVSVGAGATILIYHRFGEEKYPSTNVGVELFRKQMEYLRDKGYRVIPLAELVGALQGQRPLPERAVAITIDDGFASIYTKAWPILKSFGYPFTVFLYEQAIENRYPNFLTWEQIRELQEAGVDFQEHTYSHSRLAGRPAGKSADEHRAWVREEMRHGGEVFAQHLGVKAKYLSLPYGEYNRMVIEEAKGLGYEAVFSQDPGVVSLATDRFCIPREPILGADWSTIPHLAMVLERCDLPLRDPLPASDSSPAKKPEQFCATLLHPEAYLPGTLGIYGSAQGWQAANLQGDRLCVANRVPLKKGVNRIAVSGRERASGRTAIRYWLLLPDSESD